ncbi:NAD(P)/FAD-dependent oxidoreductase [Rhodococcus sp. X156]|uniref:NAD(P)/FAD-dependent oxidoreductase n=1 Tax=Rhodococcus sp. X156 TaxID=2499145 RepID=UPI000FDA7E1B|nr:NAD(P)/FAD-dependent oxidoreductase [Rhodococcus sp. X156]
MHDLLVAGGGPAGLAVALGAARAGLDVVVCERRGGTLDKACGEGLMPVALHALQALGVDPPGHAIRGITYRQGSLAAHAAFTAGPGRGVRRTELHRALREAVQQQGVSVLDRTVHAPVQHDDRVEAAGLCARYLVAADGLHSPLRRALGLQAPTTAAPRWGQRRHYALAPTTDHVEVTWGEHSEAYVTPVAPDTLGVAVLSATRAGFAEQLREFPLLAEQLAGATPVSPVRGAGPLRQPVRRRVAGRVLLVGDAAGYVDALTGEGLAVALGAAAELVRCVRAGRPQDYERAWARVSRRSRLITSGLLWARDRPVLARRVVPLAARAPGLFAAGVSRLAY